MSAKQVTIIPPMNPNRTCPVGIYARVSTNSKEQLDSLANQLSGLARYITTRHGWYVANIFADVASAKVGSHRPEFDRTIKACETNQISIIVTKSFSRFGRDTKEALEAIRRIKVAGKKVYFYKEGTDTDQMKTEYMLTCISICDQAENEARSENIRWGLRHKAENGTSGLYFKKCYGYKKDENGKLIIDEEKAAVVQSIFNWYLEGKSIAGIIKELEAKQIVSPTGNSKWCKRTIESMLINQKYTGNVAIKDSFDSNRLFMASGCHEGIISKETFEAVQFELATRCNVIYTETGVRRKSTKYSSKKRYTD